jgi:hypothetical protein
MAQCSGAAIEAQGAIEASYEMIHRAAGLLTRLASIDQAAVPAWADVDTGLH